MDVIRVLAEELYSEDIELSWMSLPRLDLLNSNGAVP